MENQSINQSSQSQLVDMNTSEASTKCLKRSNEESVDSLSGFEKKKLKEEIEARKKDMEVVTKQLKDNQLQQLIKNLDLYQKQKNCIDAEMKVVEKKQEEWVLKEKMVQLDIENFRNEKEKCSIDMKIVESKTQELRSKVDKLNGEKAALESKKEQKISQFGNDKLWMENEKDEYDELIAENGLETRTDDRMKNEVEAREKVHEAEILAMDANLNLLQTQLDGFVRREAESHTLKSIILKKQEELNGQEETAKKMLEDFRISHDRFSAETLELEIKKGQMEEDIEATKLAIDKITSVDGNDKKEGQDEQEIEATVVTQNEFFSNDFDVPEIPFGDGSEDKNDKNIGEEKHRNEVVDKTDSILRSTDSEQATNGNSSADDLQEKPIGFSDDLDDAEMQIVVSDESPNGEEQEDHDEEQEEGDEVQADEAPTDGPSCSTQSKKKGKSEKVQKKKPKAKVHSKPLQIHKSSELYNAKLHIKACYKKFGYSGASDAAKEAVDEIIESVEEKNCSVVQLVQGAQFPKNECRGLKSQLMQLIMGPKVERPKASASKNGPNHVHPLTYTGDLYLDVNTAKGQDVLDNAAELMKTGNNHVFGPSKKEKIQDVLEGDSRVVEAEKEFFEQQSLHSTNGRSHPVPVISKNDEEGLKHLLANASIFMVDDVDKWNGFDVKAFDLDKISKVFKPDHTVQVIRQVPQPTTTNFNFTSTDQKSNEIGIYHFTELHKLEHFLDNQNICFQALTKEAYNEILASPANKDELLKKLGEELRKNQLPLGDDENDSEDAKAMKATVPKYANLISFGTNVDLSGPTTKEQEKSCGKLPASLAPTGKGSLLNFAFEKIPGLNQVQMYLKPPAARTTGHFESNSLGSININLGPADCIWWAVPAEYSQSFAQLLNRQRRTKKSSAFSQTWWPNEEECIKQGIVVQKFVQRPGQLVYVGIGTYHWVQSEGYTANVSWNVGQLSFHQLAVAAMMNDHYLAHANYSIVPVEYISWNLVMSPEPVEEKELRQLLKVILMRSLAHQQATLDFVNEKMKSDNVELLPKNKTGLKPMKFGKDKDAVARCSTCAQVLFNFVPTNKENRIICFKCIDKYEVLKDSKIIVIQCYDLEYLVSVFDGFKIEQ
ncbi:unnamed protein product [Caenorhabditis nigoni]